MLRLLALVPALTVLTTAVPAFAQPKLTRGFEASAPATANVEETGQTGFWTMQVDLKPMRLIRTTVTDAATGEPREELVWYLVYRAINRPVKAPPQDDTVIPQNNLDPPPGPQMFVPEFTLVVEDASRQRAHEDMILPTAQATIARREMRGEDAARTLKNTVEIVQPVPPPAAADDAAEQPLYGVASWKGIDRRTANFTVYLSGFSNGFKQTTGPDGKPLILRRTLVLEFWRPGDDITVNEPQFQFRSQPRWIYRADDAPAVEPTTTE